VKTEAHPRAGAVEAHRQQSSSGGAPAPLEQAIEQARELVGRAQARTQLDALLDAIEATIDRTITGLPRVPPRRS
jgi:hypothetical protein